MDDRYQQVEHGVADGQWVVVLRIGGCAICFENLTQEDYYVIKSMQGGNVTVVHVEGLYVFVVFCNLWRFSSLDCVFAVDRKTVSNEFERTQKEIVLT